MADGSSLSPLLVGRTGGRAPDPVDPAVVVRVTVLVTGSRVKVGVTVTITVAITVVGEFEIVVDRVVVCVIWEMELAMPVRSGQHYLSIDIEVGKGQRDGQIRRQTSIL